jgi:hypothetical protein
MVVDMLLPTLKPQKIPTDHPDSCCMFRPSAEKPFVATPGAIEMYWVETILACLMVLQRKAIEHNGIDYLQVFHDASKEGNLLYIEDGEGGAITALLAIAEKKERLFACAAESTLAFCCQFARRSGNAARCGFVLLIGVKPCWLISKMAGAMNA